MIGTSLTKCVTFQVQNALISFKEHSNSLSEEIKRGINTLICIISRLPYFFTYLWIAFTSFDYF